VGRPWGTVTFLFTDIEGSTRSWETDAEAMRVALAEHDDVLRAAVASHGGWLFKHTGDGICAAFASPRAAIDAAIKAQRSLALPVRMGIATGEVEQRGDDYYGPTLNRTARVMALGHGGQVLVSGSTAGIVSGADLLDLGQHALRDLSGLEHLFQVRADGLACDFPPLRAIDAVPGNLPLQSTSFVGREAELQELVGLVRAHRLVTLTGVGGVGKTRLALEVAAELQHEFVDGVWLIALASIGEPAAVPDAVATVLGVAAQDGRTVTATIADSLVARRLLLVLDNCEHVLDAAAELIDAILARAANATVIATSREGLRVPAEHLWPVPPLDVRGDGASAAVTLFVDRATAVRPGYVLSDVPAVVEICRRLDGIALAIELAAARIVSMNPTEISERLTDRFRLLAGPRRGLEHHRTLHHAVRWSYDLLNDDERAVLQHCSVFAGGFDLAGGSFVCGQFDELSVLELLDSLVRKSLVTAEQVGEHTRYGLLETIRQFAENELAASPSDIGEVRDGHARWFSEQAVHHWALWDGPHQRIAIDWVDVEFANLRVAFRWAADRGDLQTAATVAAHTAMIAQQLQRYEPAAWAEEMLPAAIAADLDQLPRLYTAAGQCLYTGRADAAVQYSQAALGLAAESRYRSFADAWSSVHEALAEFYAARADRGLELAAALAEGSGAARIFGLIAQTFGFALPGVGRTPEAQAIADEAVAAARTSENDYWLAFALFVAGRAFAETDPAKALDLHREGLRVARDGRVQFFEAIIARDAAGLEALHGDLDAGLALFEAAIVSFHQSGDTDSLAMTLTNLAHFFDRFERLEAAASLYGCVSTHPIASYVDLAGVTEHLRASLGASRFHACVAAGSAMELGEAVQYARSQISLARSERGGQP
jgi:predicted ATPase